MSFAQSFKEAIEVARQNDTVKAGELPATAGAPHRDFPFPECEIIADNGPQGFAFESRRGSTVSAESEN
ncbi:hypothetical protein IFM12275_23650 [Nocardia sputorum]|nr:hypothetical protein IFM12275_23650 [Nocardia sputorum]